GGDAPALPPARPAADQARGAVDAAQGAGGRRRRGAADGLPVDLRTGGEGLEPGAAGRAAHRRDQAAGAAAEPDAHAYAARLSAAVVASAAKRSRPVGVEVASSRR